jgi:hypothetical protein
MRLDAARYYNKGREICQECGCANRNTLIHSLLLTETVSNVILSSHYYLPSPKSHQGRHFKAIVVTAPGAAGGNRQI